MPGHNCANEPKVFNHDEKCEAGHCPAVADVDGDGLDEVFFGHALIDHDGRVLFRHDCTSAEHQNASYVIHRQDGHCRLLFGNGGVHCLTADGRRLWQNSLDNRDGQHVVAGRFCAHSELQVAVIARGHDYTRKGRPAGLYLFDVETGKELWRGVDEFQDILVYNRGLMDDGVGKLSAIYDGWGNIVDEIEVPGSMLDNQENVTRWSGEYFCGRADVWGDSRQEVIIVGRNGVQIHANRRPLAIATLYNSTVYNGM